VVLLTVTSVPSSVPPFLPRFPPSYSLATLRRVLDTRRPTLRLIWGKAILRLGLLGLAKRERELGLGLRLGLRLRLWLRLAIPARTHSVCALAPRSGSATASAEAAGLGWRLGKGETRRGRCRLRSWRSWAPRSLSGLVPHRL
jgi:hypothetical protein